MVISKLLNEAALSCTFDFRDEKQMPHPRVYPPFTVHALHFLLNVPYCKGAYKENAM